MDFSQLRSLALEKGFTHCGQLDVKSLEFREDVRDMCASGNCPSYGKRWTCPPACRSLEEIRESAAGYGNGVLVQTVAELEDEFDGEGMMEAKSRHGAAFMALAAALREQGQDIMPMGAGACEKCEDCTYPDKPCRFPAEATSSMEACGLLVYDICQKNGVPYRYGDLTIAYTSCILY